MTANMCVRRGGRCRRQQWQQQQQPMSEWARGKTLKFAVCNINRTETASEGEREKTRSNSSSHKFNSHPVKKGNYYNCWRKMRIGRLKAGNKHLSVICPQELLTVYILISPFIPLHESLSRSHCINYFNEVAPSLLRVPSGKGVNLRTGPLMNFFFFAVFLFIPHIHLYIYTQWMTLIELQRFQDAHWVPSFSLIISSTDSPWRFLKNSYMAWCDTCIR